LIEITLKSGAEIRLPVTVDEVPAANWFKMSACERELEKLGAECQPSDFILHVTNAVRAIVEIPNSLPFGLPARSIKNKEWVLTPAFIASVDKAGVDTLEATVLNIYRHLLFTVRNFQPCSFPVDYNDKDWQITPNIKNIVYPGEFTAQETVEVLRLEAMFSEELAEARKKEFDFIQIAAADYGLTQVQTAILFRPIDENGNIEPLPMGEVAIERYINERLTELEELPYSVILSVRGFFLSFLTVVSALSSLTALSQGTRNTHHFGLE
jgi:hypothetical protein